MSDYIATRNKILKELKIRNVVILSEEFQNEEFTLTEIDRRVARYYEMEWTGPRAIIMDHGILAKWFSYTGKDYKDLTHRGIRVATFNEAEQRFGERNYPFS